MLRPFFVFFQARRGRNALTESEKEVYLQFKMTYDMMKKILFMALATVVLGACQSDKKFHVRGEVSGAEGKMLYFEASQIDGVVALDSVRLRGSGTFSFDGKRPESPEFFRLRVDNKVINFSVDSTETVTIRAPYEGFAIDYQVEGSPNSERIKELTLKQARLQQDINNLVAAAQGRHLTNDVFEDSLATLMNTYKDDVKRNYIFAAPNTAAAYFALFQKVNNFLIFDPLNSKEDIKCFAAVATSLNNFYPHALRSKNLYNVVIKGMKNTRPPQERVVEVDEELVAETGVIDISLRDLRGNVCKLSDLKGKVVLLDFTVYQSNVSVAHNFMLRDLYDKYASRGFEIYQVALDADEHFWKTTAGNLPWITVRDGNGIYSTNLALYNIQDLPTCFLINRANELSDRSDHIDDLDQAIRKLL